MAESNTNWTEVTSNGQLNAGWGVTFDANKRVPIIAKRRFATLADAQGFVDDVTSTATEAILLVVYKDPVKKNNGAYYVNKVANNDSAYGEIRTTGELIKIGSDGSGSLPVETLTVTNNKIVEATLDNIGQVIYVKTGTKDYPSGPYITTGDGTVARLGTTTPTGNLADDLAKALTDITGLQNTVGDTTKGLVKQVNDLEDKQDDYLLKTDAATTGANKVLKTNSDGKITVDTTGNATTATEAKQLTDAPVLAVSGTDKITVQAGGKTSQPFTVPYATKAGSADNAAKATNADQAANATYAESAGSANTAESANTAGHASTADSATTAANLSDNPVISSDTTDTKKIVVKAGNKTSQAFTVPYATSAGQAASATNANEATHAASANHATSADSATNATNATNAGTATNLASAPSLSKGTNDAKKIKVTAGNQTSSEFTVPYATEAGSAASAISATNAGHATSADSATTAGSATNATNATNLVDNPVLAVSGSTQITVKAGNKTSSAFTVPFATKATSADSATSATNATNAVSAQTAQVAENLNWNNITEEVTVNVGYVLNGAFKPVVDVTDKILGVWHTNMLFVDTVTGQTADSNFAVKFSDTDLNTAYDIVNVKSNGFIIPMVKDGDIYKSISTFAANVSVDNIEITIKKQS